VVEKIGEREVNIRFPEGFIPSCLYFHTVPASGVVETRFTYLYQNGLRLPVTLYLENESGAAARLEGLKQKTTAVLAELEKDYGPFLHPSLTVHVVDRNGMEYAGAAVTSEKLLGHELFHSYFARGVLFSNGSASWIDEALASWRDGGYKTKKSLRGTSGMAAHGPYGRVTDAKAYTFGADFMALLNGKLRSKGGLKPFLRSLIARKAFVPLDMDLFIHEMESFYGVSLVGDFQRYVYRM
jgi:hypothetical protein